MASESQTANGCRAGCAQLQQQQEVRGGGVAGPRNNGWILFLEVMPDISSSHMFRINRLFYILSDDILKSKAPQVIFVVVVVAAVLIDRLIEEAISQNDL